MTARALRAVSGVVAVAFGLLTASLLCACAAHGKPARRIEPGDIVFKNWAYLSAYKEEVRQITVMNMSITADDATARIAAYGQEMALKRMAAQMDKEVADLTVRYVESGKTWEIPSGTVVNIEGYFDASGNSTEPKVEGEYLYAADGNTLFAKISWDGKEGYMALSRTQ